MHLKKGHVNHVNGACEQGTQTVCVKGAHVGTASHRVRRTSTRMSDVRSHHIPSQGELTPSRKGVRAPWDFALAVASSTASC